VAAAVTALAAAAGALAAGDDGSSSSLQFMSPKGLVESDGSPHEVVEHRSALFGAADFGKYNLLSLKIKVVEEEKDDAAKGKFCPSDLPNEEVRDKILVINGFASCNFIREAAIAQNSGASALIVIENKCLESNARSGSAKWKDHCSSLGQPIPVLNYMGGSDPSVTIPAMLVSRKEGLRLIECQKQAEHKLSVENSVTGVNCTSSSDGATPVLSLRWNIPQADKVTMELWTSSLLNADIFVKPLWVQHVVPKIIDHVNFQPRYFVWDGTLLGCRDPDQPHHCEDACHNAGRYCHFDPDGFNSGKISGRDVSKENLRQLCAFKANQDQQDKWWKYISLVAERCTGKEGGDTFDNDHYYTEKCSEKMHEDAGLTFSKTQKCIEDAGGYDNDKDKINSELQEELELRKNKDIERLPSLIVNGRNVDFGVSNLNILSAVCAAFERNSRPGFCSCVMAYSPELDDADVDNYIIECFGPPTASPVSPPSNEDGGSQSSSGITFGSLIVVLFFVIGGLVGGFLVFRQRDRQRLRSEFHEDVRNIMGEYMRLDGEGDQRGGFAGGSSRNGASRVSQDDTYQPVVELS